MEKIRQQRNVGKRSLARTLTLLICMMLPFWVASCSDSSNTTPNTAGETKGPPVFFGNPNSVTFLEAQYRASHNSYSGNLKGYRGSIIQQLDAGLRFVEFDIRHSIDGDEVSFNVGHGSVGDLVDHSNDNPSETNDLRWWLARVSQWVAEYQPSEPVIVALDWKSDWNVDASPKALEALNNLLVNSNDVVNGFTHLPDYILSPVDFHANDFISDHPKSIMVVLSGNENVRDHLSTKYCFDHSIPCIGWREKGDGGFEPYTLPDAHMFVECQGDECKDDECQGDECPPKKYIFSANSASNNCDWAQTERKNGHFVRLWMVTDDNPCEWENDGAWQGPNLPATDFPYFGWYARYTEDLSAIPAFHFQDVNWWGWIPVTPGKGSNPDVAVNNLGFVVEVHKSQNYETLWCKAGKINGYYNYIDWGSGDKQYDDNGRNPSVVLTDTNLVVEIHSNDSGDLYYKCGRLNAGDGSDGSYTISWAKGEHEARWYDRGTHPWLAINENNTVVEVHEGSNGDLWYNVGTVHNSDSDDVKSIYITWHGIGNNYRKYWDLKSASRPTVALHGNLVFEAHNSVGDFQPGAPNPELWCQIGELDSSGQKINWTIPGLPQDSTYAYKTTYPYPIIDQPYSDNQFPTVALNSTGALEAHMAQDGNIWWRAGKQSNSVMAVGPTEKIQANASGTEISIDANETHAVLSYVSGNSQIYYMVGILD